MGQSKTSTKEGAAIAATLQRHHATQSSLCRELESLADCLGKRLNRQLTLSVCKRLYPTIRDAHRFEEDVLFPYLQSRCVAGDSLHASLERLRFEHWEDQSFAEEITECLHDFMLSGSGKDAEKLGYMLRGFFEGLRRHMAFESEHLVPIISSTKVSIQQQV